MKWRNIRSIRKISVPSYWESARRSSPISRKPWAELDREEFLSGRSCVLYRNGLDLTMDDLAGKEVICAEYGNSENTRTFRIAGLTDEGYYSGPMLGYPPTVIVSDAVVREFIPAGDQVCGGV